MISSLGSQRTDVGVSPSIHCDEPTIKAVYLIELMKVFSLLQSLLPEVHAFSDEESRFHLGCTWHSNDGLRDYHDIELRYIYNSERLALQGEPMPDGSWQYVEPNGRTHTISAERARAFMDNTQRSASIMLEMLEKLNRSGVMNDAIDADAQTA